VSRALALAAVLAACGRAPRLTSCADDLGGVACEARTDVHVERWVRE
jgi:hypothetical protein